MISKNQIKDKYGENLKLPPLKKYLRECERSYIIFAPKNIPEEQTPWATIIIMPPSTPHALIEISPTIIKAICTTEEYAINTFMSLFIIHRTPKMALPTNERDTIILSILLGTIKKDTRIIPYPPSFNKIPARTMDPETGASTWALGNHRWNKKIGNLIKKARIKNSLKNIFTSPVKPLKNIIIPILAVDLNNIKLSITSNKGREPKRV